MEKAKELYENYFSKDFIEEIKKYPNLTREEEVELFIQYKNGDKNARAKIINSHLKYVYNWARFYYTHYNSGIISLFDLFQEGCIGLTEAIDKIDLSWDNRFFAYFTWQIRQKMLQCLRNDVQSIKHPAWFAETEQNISKFEKKYYNENGYYPSNQEISEKINISIKTVECVKSKAKPIISLENLLNEKNNELFCDYEETFEENILSEMNSSFLLKRFQKILNKKEFEIILLKSGLKDGNVYNYSQIAKKMGVTRSAIEQTMKKIREKLIPFFEKNFPEELDRTKILELKKK